jgi:hydroxyacylglutathione hydrolase
MKRLNSRSQGGKIQGRGTGRADFVVLDIPGYTAAHIAYYGGKLLFCGDTLFACSRARLSEGTPEQMWSSLSKLALVPEDTPISGIHIGVLQP